MARRDTQIHKSDDGLYWYWWCPGCGNTSLPLKTYQETHTGACKHERQECREQ